jgi:hypothetical protein
MSRWTPTLCTALALAFGAQACSGRTWKTTNTTTVGTEQKVGKRRVVGDSLLLGPKVTPQGEVEMHLDLAPRCEREAFTVTTYRDDQEGWREGSPSPFPLYMGAILLGVGGPLLVVDDGTVRTLSVLAIIGGGVLIGSYIRSGSGNRVEYRSRKRTVDSGKSWVASDCGDSEHRAVRARIPSPVTVAAPWGASQAQPSSNGIARFRFDWGASGIDPLAADAKQRLRTGWHLEAPGYSRVEFRLDDPSVEAALRALSADTGIDASAGRDVDLPELKVAGFEIRDAGGKVLPAARAGTRVKLAVTLANEGKGSAYRVTATSRSGEPSLHGLSFSFGRIAPGQTITREVEVAVPRERKKDQAIVVLVFDEANRNAPANAAEKVMIDAAQRPALALNCELGSGVDLRKGQKPVVNVNTPVEVRCTLENKGDGPALAARVTGTVGNEPSKTTVKRDLQPSERARFDLLLQAPKNAQRGDQLNLDLTAAEDNFGERAGVRIPLVVGMPNICPDRMDHKQFEAQKKKLQEELKDDPELLEETLIQLTGCITD